MKILFLLFVFNIALLKAEYGIDVSVWQGYINWSDVKREKSFAFIRSSVKTILLFFLLIFIYFKKYGVTEDSRFSENWPNAKATGMSVGPYHFFEPGDNPTS